MSVLKVLIVEDSRATREMLAAAVQAVGTVEVHTAVSGFEALKVLPRHRFALIVTDINMPDINGLELVNFIRKSEHHRATPLIIVSTQAGERDRLRGIALGADAFIAKPFEPEDLRDLVVAFLTRGRRSNPGRPSGAPPSST